MKVTNKIHALKIPFEVPATSGVKIERFVYVYLIFGQTLHQSGTGQNIYLIDSGVAGSQKIIYEYINSQVRRPEKIAALILTHSHPDHIGSAKSIKQTDRCKLYVHEAEAAWVEDTQRQLKERPVPGFSSLVEGPAQVDEFLPDGSSLELEEKVSLKIIHTPGHSKGSVSILYENESALFTGDCLIAPGDLPIYENIADLIKSIRKLQNIHPVNVLLSSWEVPIKGRENIARRMNESLQYLDKIHRTVLQISGGRKIEPMQLCKQVIKALGLPPAAINPLVAKGFASSLDIGREKL
jgi:hydroxyacylglutathione hydrolase